MFGRKSNLTQQTKLKEDLLCELKDVVRQLELGKYNKALNKNDMDGFAEQLKQACIMLDNSVGFGQSNIANGCSIVREHLAVLSKDLKGNLLGRIEDSIVNLLVGIQDIVDLQDGKISTIDLDVNQQSRGQKLLYKKLEELQEIEQAFTNSKNRVEDQIARLERDKQELDQKLLQESNPRIKQNIFLQIKNNKNNIETLKIKSTQYLSCYSLLNSVKVFANELIQSGELSRIELDKAKIILNIGRLRAVIDQPAKLKPLLMAIENDLKKAQDNMKLIDAQLSSTFKISQDDYAEMNEYQNNLLNSESQKMEIENGTEELEEYLKSLEKVNK